MASTNKHSVCVEWQNETSEYKYRLASFQASSIPTSDQHGFAKSGFYFTGYGDFVRCMGCQVRRKIFDIRQNPYTEHKRLWPDCIFIRQIESLKCKPLYPEYQELGERARTYPTWPEKNLHSINALAAAGFYYVGPKDRVRCFHCGIALRDWGSEDDPVTVHKTVCPYCVYIHGSSLQLMGVSTHAYAQEADVDLLRKSVSGATASDVKPAIPIQLFQSLSNLGFDEDTIKQEMIIKKIKTGGSFQSAGEFLNTVWKRGKVFKQGTFNSSTDEAGKEDLIAENIYLREMLFCKVCREPSKSASVLFLPCGHLVTCNDCAVSVSNCIVCDKSIKGTVSVKRF